MPWELSGKKRGRQEWAEGELNQEADTREALPDPVGLVSPHNCLHLRKAVKRAAGGERQ